VARVQSRDGFLVRSCTFWSNGDRYVLVQVHRGVSASRDQFELSRLPADRPVAGVVGGGREGHIPLQSTSAGWAVASPGKPSTPEA
jgi:hypothetical protein